jgi:YD repeat-containing protein
MKNPILLSAFLGIFTFVSCKKDNNTTNTNSSALPKTYTEDIRSSAIGNSVTVYNLTYDPNNRIISMDATPAPPVLQFQYAYASDNTYTMNLYSYGSLSIHEKFWVNTTSLMDSTFQYNDTEDTTTEKYLYNTDKQLLQIKEYDYSNAVSVLSNTTSYTYDANGNPITESDDQGKLITYDYYTDLTNTLTMGAVYTYHSKNLIKTATTQSGGSQVTATHFYSFDSSNRLTRDSITTTVADLTVIKSYTY